MDKAIELCNIPKCSDKMWLYIIVTFVCFITIIVFTLIIFLCKKYKKRGVTNIQNVSVYTKNVNQQYYYVRLYLIYKLLKGEKMLLKFYIVLPFNVDFCYKRTL